MEDEETEMIGSSVSGWAAGNNFEEAYKGLQEDVSVEVVFDYILDDESPVEGVYCIAEIDSGSVRFDVRGDSKEEVRKARKYGEALYEKAMRNELDQLSTQRRKV